MKYLILVAVVFLSGCWAKSLPGSSGANRLTADGNRTITDETLRQLMEAVKGLFDPTMSFTGVSFVKNATGMYVNASLPEIQVVGLTGYNETYTKADMEKLEYIIVLDFPAINVTGLYDLKLDVDLGDYGLHAFGNSTFSVNGTHLGIGLNLTLDLTQNNTIAVNDFNIDFNISEVKVRFDDLQGGGEVSDVLNELINEALPDLVELARPGIVSAAKTKVLNLGHAFIDGLTMDSLIDYIYMIIDMGGFF